MILLTPWADLSFWQATASARAPSGLKPPYPILPPCLPAVGWIQLFKSSSCLTVAHTFFRHPWPSPTEYIEASNRGSCQAAGRSSIASPTPNPRRRRAQGGRAMERGGAAPRRPGVQAGGAAWVRQRVGVWRHWCRAGRAMEHGQTANPSAGDAGRESDGAWANRQP